MIVSFIEIVIVYKIMMKKIPELDIKKKNEWALHKDNLVIDFPITEYSNLSLKWIEIIQRIDNINELIKNLFTDFQLINADILSDKIIESYIKTPLHYKQKFLTEQIFYWIRKTIDEIISIIYVLEYLKKYNEFPMQIKIDCIGKLLNEKNILSKIKNKYLELFKIINDISNTYKHSFLNSEVHNHIGEKDPLVFSYGFKNNDLKKEKIFTSYKIEDIINSINPLIIDFIEHIKKI